MKQSAASEGVYDPGLVALLETLPKDVETTPIKQPKKAVESTPQKGTSAKGTPAPAKSTPVKPKGKRKRRERRARRKRRERRMQMMDLMTPRVMMSGHQMHQLMSQSDATGISAVVSCFVFVVWTHAIFAI